MKLNELMEKYGDYEVKEGFMELLEKPKPKTVYNLKYGDSYFFLTALGTIMTGIWHNDGTDFNRRRIGNTFLTIEDAKFASERLKVIAELKEYAKEFSDEEWKNKDLPKYNIKSDCENYAIRIVYERCLKGNDIYFGTEEMAEIAVETVGKDRVKKYYLGVKE